MHKSKSQLIQEAKEFIRIGRLYCPEDLDIILKDYQEICLDTQLSIAGICHLEEISKYVIKNDLIGAFVECGTWRGGAIGYWARSFLRNGGDPNKSKLYGFDSFEGMPRMTIEDGEYTSQWLYGKSLTEIDISLLSGELVKTGVNVAPENTCIELVKTSGYPQEYINIRKGWFQNTLPDSKAEIGPISVLRLDADLYNATKFCLETLYENVVRGGVVIVDDYGCFEGCKKAVDEFVKQSQFKINLIPIDYSIRYFFKP